MIARPAIVMQKVDPLYTATRIHFQDLFQRYGSPLCVLNLVRQQERRAREVIIGTAYTQAIQFINQFLPEQHKIDYVAWDFKLANKSKTLSVVDELGLLAHWSVIRTGIFHSHPHPDSTQQTPTSTVHITPSPHTIHHLPDQVYIGRFQSGVLRTNCVDSIDRTNVAQFCVAKCALGYQLFSMGLIDSVHIDASSDIVHVLLDMFERMGDCIALQYGGSQMHRQMKKVPLCVPVYVRVCARTYMRDGVV